MKSFFTTFALTLLVSLIGKTAMATEPPVGFQDPALLAKVMAGQIVVTVVTETELEKRVYLRAYFNKVSTEAYAKAATNHPRYKDLFKEVAKGETLSTRVVSESQTEVKYSMEILFAYGPFTLHAYPEGTQLVTLPKDPTLEASIHNDITNYQDVFEIGKQHTRMIPWENGFLAEDELHVKVKKADSKSKAIKDHMVKQFTNFLDGFRKDLGGDRP